MPMSILAQVPTLTNGTPGTAFPGEQFTMDMDITNTGGPGYGPYIRIILPAAITFDSAAFMGSGVTTANVGVFPAAPGNQLTDPWNEESVTGPEGGSFIVANIPVSAVVAGGPPLTINTAFTIDGATAVGTNLDVTVQPVYKYGDTATGSNGSITGTANTKQVTTTLAVLTKTNNTREAEIPPGPSFQYTYTITVDVANGKSVFDPVVEDIHRTS